MTNREKINCFIRQGYEEVIAMSDIDFVNKWITSCSTLSSRLCDFVVKAGYNGRLYDESDLIHWLKQEEQ